MWHGNGLRTCLRDNATIKSNNYIGVAMTSIEKQEMCLRCPHCKYYPGMQAERIYCEVEDKYIVFDRRDGWKICTTLHTVASSIVTYMI